MKYLPVLTRVFLLLTIVGAGYYFFTSNSHQLSSQLEPLTNITQALNLDTSKIETLAKEKFVDQQPILSDNEKPKEVVLGESTQALTNQVENFVSKTSAAISEEVKNLPKKEAANLLKQACEQMITELEK